MDGVICMSEVIDISPDNLDSSLGFISLVFYMMYSAYKLNKQGDNICGTAPTTAHLKKKLSRGRKTRVCCLFAT